MVLLEDCPLEQRLAANVAPRGARNRYAALFALDRYLALAHARGREPLAVQLRLAWWRELLSGAPAPRGDPAVAAIRAAWDGRLAELLPMVDGWEEMTAERPDYGIVATSRGEPFVTLLRDLGGDEDQCRSASVAASRWLLVDMANRLANGASRQEALALARALPRERTRLPRAARPLALLDGLTRRALRRGGGPLLGDRWSPLAAIRLGIFGR
jgi:phytoene synthase